MGQIIDGAFYSDYDTQDIDRRLAIAGGVSNPNLLDNPWFTVNQMEATSGVNTSGAYIADRWTVSWESGGITWSKTNDSITFQPTSNTGNPYIIQKIGESLYNFLGNKTVTVSVMLGDYSVLSATAIFNSEASIAFNKVLAVDSQGNRTICSIYKSSRMFTILQENTPITIRAVKLELGSVSTLANDVAPDYTTELLKCQRYFRRIKGKIYRTIATGLTVSSTDIEFPLIMSPEMVSKPTITVAGTWVINLGTGSYSVTSIVISSVSDGQVVDLDAKSTGMTAGTVGLLQCASNDCYIDLSADL